MTTLTPMEKTATGWKCPACGDTLDPGPLDIARAVECNCVVDPFRYSLAVTLTAEQLRERFPRHGRAEKAGDRVELVPYETWASTTHPRKP